VAFINNFPDTSKAHPPKRKKTTLEVKSLF
jgi:hypothetical protein